MPCLPSCQAYRELTGAKQCLEMFSLVAQGPFRMFSLDSRQDSRNVQDLILQKVSCTACMTRSWHFGSLYLELAKAGCSYELL